MARRKEGERERKKGKRVKVWEKREIEGSRGKKS